MQISSRFTIAIHIFACIATFEKDYKITSEFLASSVNVNPVIIRKLLSQLKAAGLVTVTRGSGGAAIAKPLEEITLLTFIRLWTVWNMGNSFISMRTRLCNVLLGAISIAFSMTSWSGFKMPWSRK